jgi:diacylglycerol kinase family enzyme
MKFFCLVNPVSGGKRGKLFLAALEEAKAKGLFNGTVEELRQKNLKEQLKRACQYDRILIAGGDGTFSLVISALEEPAPPLGLLPLGTGNDLSKEIGIYKLFSYKNPLSLIEFYKTASLKPLAVWKFEYGTNFETFIKFINYISFGMDAEIVARFSMWRKSPYYRPVSRFGIHGNRIAYAGAGLFHLFTRLNLKEMSFKKDNTQLQLESSKCRSLIFSNIRSMMGLGISNTESNYSDKKVELIVANNLFNYLSMIFRLKGPCPRPVFYGGGECWNVENMPADTFMQADGEALGKIGSSNFRIVPAGSVSLMVNAD